MIDNQPASDGIAKAIDALREFCEAAAPAMATFVMDLADAYNADYLVSMAQGFERDGVEGAGVLWRIAEALERQHELDGRRLEYTRHAISHLEYLKPVAMAARAWLEREQSQARDACEALRLELEGLEKRANLALARFNAADAALTRMWNQANGWLAPAIPTPDIERQKAYVARCEQEYAAADTELELFIRRHPELVNRSPEQQTLWDAPVVEVPGFPEGGILAFTGTDFESAARAMHDYAERARAAQSGAGGEDDN